MSDSGLGGVRKDEVREMVRENGRSLNILLYFSAIGSPVSDGRFRGRVWHFLAFF
jgi:hypothetical protein